MSKWAAKHSPQRRSWAQDSGLFVNEGEGLPRSVWHQTHDFIVCGDLRVEDLLLRDIFVSLPVNRDVWHIVSHPVFKSVPVQPSVKGSGLFLNLSELTVGVSLPRDNGNIKASFCKLNSPLQIHGHYLGCQIFITDPSFIMKRLLLPLWVVFISM